MVLLYWIKFMVELCKYLILFVLSGIVDIWNFSFYVRGKIIIIMIVLLDFLF